MVARLRGAERGRERADLKRYLNQICLNFIVVHFPIPD